jgi:hypothetical protein
MGMEAGLYSFIEVARAVRVVQAGFDETIINGMSTMNTWVRIENRDGQLRDIHLTGAEPLVCGTAEGVTAHVVYQFERAQEQLDALRALLTKQDEEECYKILAVQWRKNRKRIECWEALCVEVNEEGVVFSRNLKNGIIDPKKTVHYTMFSDKIGDSVTEMIEAYKTKFGA